MPILKEISLDLGESIVDAYKADEVYKKLSKQFNVSQNGVEALSRSLKPPKHPSHQTSKVLERKLFWTVNKNPRVNATTLVSDAAHSGVTVSKSLTQKWALCSQTIENSISEEKTSKSQIRLCKMQHGERLFILEACYMVR